jgi:AcrR family transcriptional regulator
MPQRAIAPRGRHAPPLEVRLGAQRERLIAAAATVFARLGYAAASAESIAREASMSKATFYEHFANKEEAILALFDTASETVMRAIVAAASAAGSDPAERVRAGVHAFLQTMADQPDAARTLLVEIVGAGPAATERRDAVFATFADVIDRENAEAARRGLAQRAPSKHDSYAVVGAIGELTSRQLGLGVPGDIRELEPVVDRLILALMAQPSRDPA